ncbi:hypothetical protein WR25_09450 [Diploscapter pachys]|uniref:Thioredoxin domain-containing protein n=1 Tax=Diploscapter pachys TaxID=2018661 RepID=A0A2A2K3V8_9BILA|nr:hypothetical protein WR25_09450 [Diploscapter pachys]
MSVTEVYSLDEINSLLNGLSSTQLMIIDFTADWCEPSRVNIDKAINVMLQYGVQSVPTFVFLKNKVEVGRVNGSNRDNLVAAITQHYSAPPLPNTALEQQSPQQFAEVSKSTWEARMSQRSGGNTPLSSRSASIASGREPADSVGVIETRWPLQADEQAHEHRQESEKIMQGTTVFSSSQGKIETTHTEDVYYKSAQYSSGQEPQIESYGHHSQTTESHQ